MASSCLLAEEIDWKAVEPDLKVPEVIEGKPAAGKRVRVRFAEYKDTQIYHALYLPAEWKPEETYPVIIEYAGNRHAHGDGSVESCKLGYGISGGKGVIWVSMPFVDSKTQANAPKWWGDTDATVAYCKRTVKQVCEEFGGDATKVFIAGFSRGSIAANYIGLHDDEIAKLWCGFICHSHYEGVRDWPQSNANLGFERLKRLRGRPQWISHEKSVDAARDYLKDMRPNGKFTFVSLPFPEHTDRWVLRDIPPRQQLRDWFITEIAGAADTVVRFKARHWADDVEIIVRQGPYDFSKHKFTGGGFADELNPEKEGDSGPAKVDGVELAGTDGCMPFEKGEQHPVMETICDIQLNWGGENIPVPKLLHINLLNLSLRDVGDWKGIQFIPDEKGNSILVQARGGDGGASYLVSLILRKDGQHRQIYHGHWEGRLPAVEHAWKVAIEAETETLKE